MLNQSNRKPFHADIVVFYVCIIIGVWYCGYLYGSAQTPVCDKPVAKKLSVHDMTKQNMRRWARYYANRGM
jgi:hypothetical protein